MQKPKNFHVFWGAKAVLSRSRRPQDGAKTDRDGAQTDQDGAKTRQVGTKTPRDDAKTAQDGGRTGQIGPKAENMTPKRPQDDPKWFQDAQDGSKMFRRCIQDAPKWFMLETPLGERSERASAASEASGAIRMNSRGLLRKSISKDAFRVREGCFRKAIQIVSPRGFILNALPVLLLTPGL